MPEDQDPVATWIAGLQRGDNDAVRRLFDQYFERLLVLAAQRIEGLRSRAKDENDIVQSARWAVFAGRRRRSIVGFGRRTGRWATVACDYGPQGGRMATSRTGRQTRWRQGAGRIRVIRRRLGRCGLPVFGSGCRQRPERAVVRPRHDDRGPLADPRAGRGPGSRGTADVRPGRLPTAADAGPVLAEGPPGAEGLSRPAALVPNTPQTRRSPRHAIHPIKAASRSSRRPATGILRGWMSFTGREDATALPVVTVSRWAGAGGFAVSATLTPPSLFAVRAVCTWSALAHPTVIAPADRSPPSASARRTPQPNCRICRGWNRRVGQSGPTSRNTESLIRSTGATEPDRR